VFEYPSWTVWPNTRMLQRALHPIACASIFCLGPLYVSLLPRLHGQSVHQSQQISLQSHSSYCLCHLNGNAQGLQTLLADSCGLFESRVLYVSTKHMFSNRLSNLFKWYLFIAGRFGILFHYASCNGRKPFEPRAQRTCVFKERPEKAMTYVPRVHRSGCSYS
jgi:hypothetical protein